MSENITIARPYAKAVFAHALGASQLELWSKVLQGFAFISSDAVSQAFLNNPSTTHQQQQDLFDITDRFVELDGEAKQARNFIALLADNGRLPVLPEIFFLYEQYRADYEKTLTVTVRTYLPLSEEQKEKLRAVLEQKLLRSIEIEEVLDKSNFGGAIIQAGDLVIDGSVRGKLNKLEAAIAA